MSQYDEIDKRIISAITTRKHPLYEKHVVAEATRIEADTGRDGFRVIDGRLQALRKAGKIRYLTKSESNGQGGWHVVTPNDGGERR